MLRYHSELFSPPHSLRRRQLSQNSEAGLSNSGTRPGHVLSGCSNQILDLSICHPSQPFSNRFSVLATPTPSFAKPSTYLRDFPATNSRRTRKSRGTKEAKKRRDMRRNRRKLAAQLLDQQLSQAVDETLTKANIHPPPLPPRSACALPALPAPTPVFPTTLRSAKRILRQSNSFPPTPPELPLPRFTDFDLSIFPRLSPLPSTPLPVQTPTPFRTLPKWCPKIPSLTLGDVWRDCLPTFFDLSSLPEVASGRSGSQQSETESHICKDMQLWRPIGVGFGREQSKFFPSRYLRAAEGDGFMARSKARVKLPPPVGCRLRASDCGAVSPEMPFQEQLDQHQPSYQELTLSTLQHNEVDLTSSKLDSAAETLRALSATPSIGCPSMGLNGPSVPSSVSHGAVDPYRQFIVRHPSYDNDYPPPYELDGREFTFPFVHANALTGYSNGSDVTVVPYRHEEQLLLSDSGIGMPVVQLSEECNVGLNELVIDRDIFGFNELQVAAAVPLPESMHATPLNNSVGDLAAVLPIDCIHESEHLDSDAHFRSEQALFYQSPPSHENKVPISHNVLDRSSINIAEFLKLGHAKNCWCGRCTDEPYDIATEETEDSISASAKLTKNNVTPSETDDDSALSVVFNPSESEPDCDLEALEMPSPVEPIGRQIRLVDKEFETAEDDDWLFFSPIAAEYYPPSSSPVYFPSSPILHRHRQRAPTPTTVITSSDTSSQGPSDDYVAVASPSITLPASSGTRPRDSVPRRPSSAWETGLATYGDEGIGCGFATALENSWRWGMEDDEEWWDWAVEDDC